MKIRSIFAFFILLVGSGSLGAQSADFFPLEDVKPGLEGVGRTIFEGVEIEEFGVRILGVVRNVSPGQNMILARLSGEKVEKTGVFAGMSGSPVYIDGKILGAVAYSYAFSKEPIAGITPISEMVEIFKGQPASKRAVSRGPRRPVSQLLEMANGQIPMTPAYSPAAIPVNTNGLDRSADLTPIATPVNLGGISAASLRHFSQSFAGLGLTPVRGSATSSSADYPDTPLAPGSTVTVQMVRGDMDVSAAGTLTHISGDNIYAFGHPFMGTGFTEMPMAKGAVMAVVSSLQSSHKVTATLESIGTLRQDRATGLLGQTGVDADLLPVKLDLLTSRNKRKEYRFEMVKDSFLTPFLMTLAVFNSLAASERTMGGQSLQVKCSISIKDQPEVLFENSISDLANGPVMAAISAASPVNFLLTSGFDRLEVQGIEIEIQAIEEEQSARLDRVWVDRGTVSAGEEITVGMLLRKPNGDALQEEFTIRVPEEVSPGPLQLLVGDGMSVIRSDNEMQSVEFIPESIPQLIRAINNLKRNNRLYVRLYRNGAGGFAVGSRGLPGLPPSMLEIYGSKRQSGETQKINRVVFLERELPAAQFVLQGREVIELEVKG